MKSFKPKMQNISFGVYPDDSHIVVFWLVNTSSSSNKENHDM